MNTFELRVDLQLKTIQKRCVIQERPSLGIKMLLAGSRLPKNEIARVQTTDDSVEMGKIVIHSLFHDRSLRCQI